MAVNSAKYVAEQVELLKKSGKPLQYVAWLVALLCVGWAYVFGARGALCTPANRRASYKSKGADHPTIKTKCQVIRDSNPKANCNGCKWFPNGENTRYFDCRGFTYWVLYIVFGWKLQGAGATSQWNTKSNWKSKGEIKTMPKDTLVCLFIKKGNTMSHTGFGYNDETVECSNGVQHKKLDSRWTHWGIPACCDSSYKPPVEKEEKKVSKPTLKSGSKGDYVKQAQTLLAKKGYDIGKSGIDGKFGSATLAAVKKFQKDNGLTQDGIIGTKTWQKLEEEAGVKLYTVIITGLSKTQADALKKQYPKAVVKGGE